MATERTSVTFESTVEKRAGQQVVVIVKTTTVTPVSNRGTEWQKQQSRTETTVVPVKEAHDLLTSLTDAFIFALDGVPEFKGERVSLQSVLGDEYGQFYTVAEAEERARKLQDEFGASDYDKLVVRWLDRDDLANVVSVVERGA